MSTAVLQMIMKAKDNASGVIGKVASSLARMLEVAGGTLMANALQRLAGWLGGVVKEAALSAARVVEMTAVLGALARNAGLSEDAVMGYVESVKAAGITTQVAQTTVARFIQNNLDLARSQDIARVAQDAAVLSMTDSSDALEGIIHGITTMNTRVLRTYGINIGNVSDAWEIYGKVIGKSTEDMNVNEKQTAVMNAVMAQGERIAGAYEAAMGTAGKQLRSMKRHVVELFNAMGMPLQDAFSMAISSATNFLKFLKAMSQEGEPLARIMASIGRIFSVLFSSGADASASALDTLVGVMERLATTLEIVAFRMELAKTFFEIGRISDALEVLGIPKDFQEKVLEVVARVEEFADALLTIDVKPILEIASFIGIAVSVGTAVGRLLFFIKGLPAMLSAARIAFMAFGAVVGAVSWPLVLLAAAIGILVAVIVKFGAQAYENFLALKDQVVAIFMALGERISDAWNEAKIKSIKAIESYRNMVVLRFLQVKEAVTEKMEAIRSSIISKWEESRSSTKKKIDNIKKTISTAWSKIKDAVSNRLDEIGDTISSKFAEFLEAIGVTEEIKERWRVIWEDVQLILEAIVSRLLLKVAEVGLGILAGWNQVRAWTVAVWATISQAIIMAWETIKVTVGELVSGFLEWMIETWMIWSEWFGLYWDMLVLKITEVWNSILLFLGSIILLIVLAVQSKMTAMATWLHGKWTFIKDKAVEAWMTIKAKIIKIWEVIKEKAREKMLALILLIQKKFDALITKIQGYKERAIAAGKALIEGMKEGVLSAVAGLIAAVTQAVEDALAAAKAALLQKSPSKKGIEIGANFINSISLGVKDEMPGLASSFARIGEAMAGTMSGQMAGATPSFAGAPAGGGGSMVKVELVYSPTISLADEAEVQDKIIPFVEQGIRKAQEEGKI